MNSEKQRLQEDIARTANWKRWGEDGLQGWSDRKSRLCFLSPFGTPTIPF